MSGLIWGVKNGDLNAVQACVDQQNANVNEMSDGRYPLHFAADFGQAEVVAYLVSKGADVNAADKYGITPLLSAIFEGHEHCVKILLDSGADKNKLHEGQSYASYAETDAIKSLLQ